MSVRGLGSVEPPKRYLTEVGAVALVVATWVGAAMARPIPLAIGLVVVGAAMVSRRPALLVAGCGLLACSLAASAWAGLVPVQDGPYEGSVLLVSDPTDTANAVRADVKLEDGRRVELWARGGAARSLGDALAGERVVVRGELEPPPEAAEWLAVRHVVGRLTVDAVAGAPRSNDAAATVANGYRRVLTAGSFALPEDHRPLFLGFVLGDDRGQDPAVVDDFRGAGLSHLLVVSGQNVAFLLLLARPLLGRLSMPVRLSATVGVLLWFAMLTRFEPSVLRATAMAGVSALAVFRGAQISAIRVLALAVTALLLVDPLLNASVGFRLSVGASAGIVLLAKPIAGALPGPHSLREALGVTLAAQAGVMPVLVTAFGGVPVASIIANLLAVPAAGPVMMWGLTGGAVAGLVGPVAGGWASRLIHLPTRLLLEWVSAVARVATGAPLGQFTLVTGLVVATALGAFLWARRTERRRLARLCGLAIVGALVVPALGLRSVVPGSTTLAQGATLWRSGGAVVLVVDDARASPTEVLEGVRRRGVGRIDLYVSASGARSAAVLLETVRSRIEVIEAWQPVNGMLTEARTVSTSRQVMLGPLEVGVEAVDPRLVTRVRLVAT